MKGEYERHRVESEEISRQAIQGVKYLLLGFVLLVISGIFIAKAISSQPQTYTVTTRESVVISKMMFPPGKNSEVVVKYRRLDGTRGEFETREIWFSIGDTIPINISKEVLIKDKDK